MQIEELRTDVSRVLDEKKALDIVQIDVQGKTSICDFMVVATGTSERHLQSLANYIVESVKKAGVTPLGVEGKPGADWVLLDLGDVIVHLMTAKAREFYALEKLWDPSLVDEIEVIEG
ncbi:MAG: ribosome silencing factor [Methylococcales bacterium]|jgi:ribosome-associated protein|nr:ribosome silencing factor [Methylococcales bacterium]